MTKKHTMVIRLTGLLLLLTALFVGGRAFVFWKIKQGILTEIEKLKESGWQISYRSIEVNAWNGSIYVKQPGFHWGDTAMRCRQGVDFHGIEVNGISILPLLFEKSLSVSDIILHHPTMRYRHVPQIQWGKPKEGNSLKGISVGSVMVNQASLEWLDSVSCEVALNSHFDFTSTAISFSKPDEKIPKWGMQTLVISHVQVSLPQDGYAITMKKLMYEQQAMSVRLDSISVTPALGRIEFAEKAGRQLDQISCLIPSLQMEGFEWPQLNNPAFNANQVNLQFVLEVFRDKRYPDGKRKQSILPVAFLQKLPFPVWIDSLKIAPSFISYEEFPEEGVTAGKIIFDDVAATISHISNEASGETVMNVTSRFMNAGDLKAHFTFPLDGKSQYSVKGTLSDFDLPAINKMLGPIALNKVEAGKLQEMKFHFKYNELESIGELELRYTGLSMMSIRNDKAKSKKGFATFLINTLIRNNMDKTDPKDRRTGPIQWKRDPLAGIFSYWWKSILSGIKGVFGV